MPDGTSTIIQATWEVIKYPIILIMGLLGFNLKRLVERVDKIDDEYTNEEDFNKTVSSFRTDMKDGFKQVEDGYKEGHKELRQDIRNMHARIDKIKDSE